MESIIKDEIIKHLNIFKFINGSQHGFTKGRSCITNLLEFSEKVTDAIDKGKPFVCIYLNFTKVFHKVPHLRLIKKLKAHGVDTNVVKWIFSWLTGMRHRVVINGGHQLGKCYQRGSARFCIRTVVIFLFISINININYISISISNINLYQLFIYIDTYLFSKICKFADDAKIGRVVATEHEVKLLRDDLKKLAKWAID